MDFTDIENIMITKYRDQFYIERKDILNDYASKTSDKGIMYYVYSENSRNENGYNICICEENQSNVVIEKDREELPYGVNIGTVLRESENEFYIDEEATEEVGTLLNETKERLLEEQKEYLDSRRVEGHVYELYEKNEDRACLFDITQDDNEGIEEIEFPKELLNESEEGETFIYQDGEYRRK